MLNLLAINNKIIIFYIGPIKIIKLKIFAVNIFAERTILYPQNTRRKLSICTTICRKKTTTYKTLMLVIFLWSARLNKRMIKLTYIITQRIHQTIVETYTFHLAQTKC